MPYCTVVEFEWDDPAQRAAFEALTRATGDEPAVAGRLVRVLSVDDKGGRAIEVWAAPDDARRHAEHTSPDVGSAALPAPTHLHGFEVTTLEIV